MRFLARRVKRVAPAVHDDRGAVAVITAIFLIVVIGMGAYVLDLAQMRQDRAFNRRSADLVATAAAVTLARPEGTMTAACTDAWSYFKDNTPDVGAVTTAPPCSTAFSGDCNPSVSRSAAGVTPRYIVRFTNPVLDDDRFMTSPDIAGGATQAKNDEIDGSPCERIGVEITHTRQSLFGAVLGKPQFSTTSRSVSRINTRFDIGGPIALLLLNKTDCNVVTAGGQAKIFVNPSGSKPGYITVDSSATGASCNQNNTYALDALGTQNSRIVANAVASTGASGVIRMYALAAGQGNTKAYEPADITGTPTRVSPKPTPASQRVGRDKVDWTFNCVANGRDNTANTSDDCPYTETSGPYIDKLVNTIGNGTSSNVPTGYTVYPRGNHPEDKCTNNAGDSNVNLPAGNWLVVCTDLTIKNSWTIAGPSNIVFQGNLTLSSAGSLTIGNASANSILYFRHGVFNKDAQASLLMYRTFVYVNPDSNNAYLTFGAGSGTLLWTAPIGGNFDALSLWSESTHQHEFGGQAQMTVEGVFFMPNANFVFTGQSGQDNTVASQFIVDKLTLSGQGTLTLQPTVDRVVQNPAFGAVLIR
jgi:hypothetical protein